MSIVYLCGNTEKEEWRDGYDNCETVLTALGFDVLSLSRMPDIEDKEKRDKIQKAMIDASETVCMISGWERSEEAVLQFAYANKSGKSFFRYSPKVVFRPKTVTIKKAGV